MDRSRHTALPLMDMVLETLGICNDAVSDLISINFTRIRAAESGTLTGQGNSVIIRIIAPLSKGQFRISGSDCRSRLTKVKKFWKGKGPRQGFCFFGAGMLALDRLVSVQLQSGAPFTFAENTV